MSACSRSGRNPAEITLVAASKTRTPDEILALHEAGVIDFGENYWQEARDKIAALPHTIRWHFIGTLQENKARYIAAHFPVLETLDSLQLADTLSKKLLAVDRTCQVLVEVNIDSERTKSGVAPEEALRIAEHAARLPGLVVKGLMTMGAPGADEVTLRARFRAMRGLFERLPPELRQELSMGMSDDFEVAIEEGATMVRIGTAIFGSRSET